MQEFIALSEKIFFAVLVFFITIGIIRIKKYRNSTYYQITKVPYFLLTRDKGKYGEYLIYKKLKKFEKNGAKFLFNLYIPKWNGETTEIDLLMICKKGIFVFESKNYSGWIFGNENQKNWYQVFPKKNGKSYKVPFYNPVMQNRSHIKHLTAFLGKKFLIHSIIVFSERCTLKEMEVESTEIKVIKCNQLRSVVTKICRKTKRDVFTEDDITWIYDRLYPRTQCSEKVKRKHVADIQRNLKQWE